MTDGEYETLKARWLREHGQNHNAHRVRLLTPLPFRVRLRLAVERRIDNTSFWLIGHHRMR